MADVDIGVNLNDVWRLKFNFAEGTQQIEDLTLSWEYVGLMSYNVHFHSSAVHQSSNKVYIFGGNTSSRVLAGVRRTNYLSAFGT